MEDTIPPGEPRKWNRWPTQALGAATVMLAGLAVVAFMQGWSVNAPVLVVPAMALTAGTGFWQLRDPRTPPPAAFVVNKRRNEFAVPARLAFHANLAAGSLASLTTLMAAPVAFFRPLLPQGDRLVGGADRRR